MAKTKAKKPNAISKVNRQITIGFVLVTIILVLIIGYFSFSRATIYLTPQKFPLQATVEIEILPEVTSTLTSSNIMPGKIDTFTATSSATFESSQTTTQSSKASGEVTIINNYSRNQTLVATTRLLSPAGKLFRTTETIVVPAGTKLSVPVKADQPGKEFEIGPSKFTIPGLWEGIQDKIYAESDKNMTIESKTSKTVTPTDLENAKQSLLKQIINDVKISRQSSEEYLIIKTETTATESSAPAGTKIDNFVFSLEAKITTIQFSQSALQTIAINNLKIDVPKDQEYLSFDPDSLTYELNRLDPDGNSANINVAIKGATSAKIDALFDKNDILGLAKLDVQDYFKKIKGIQTVKVNFSPSWVKSVPPLKDHVIIEIIK